jgi:hypothetical protein
MCSIETKNRFVIFAIHTYEVDTKAYFASTRQEAEQRKEEAERAHGSEFRIYAC